MNEAKQISLFSASFVKLANSKMLEWLRQLAIINYWELTRNL